MLSPSNSTQGLPRKYSKNQLQVNSTPTRFRHILFEDVMYVSRSIAWISCVLLAYPLASGRHPVTQTAGNEPSSPVQLTSEQDYQRILDLLHNPLVLKNGQQGKTSAMWWKERRPEIAEDFDREIYGRAPKNTPKVNWEITSTTRENNGDVPVITKKLIGHVDNSAYPLITVDIQLTLSVPANATGPVPVIMELAFDPEFLAAMRKRLSESQVAALNGNAWQQQVLAKGWGYAVLIPTSVQADNGAGLTEGIIGLVNKGQPRKLDDWGALRAWAWGASRALDYFETDKSVDAKQVGIEGLSRYGKAALVAMAYDPRFSIAFVGS